MTNTESATRRQRRIAPCGWMVAREQRPRIRHYDLVLVERAPLPPHERSWRHPSEIGPTHLDVDTGGHSRFAMLATGTIAVVVVAAMVVAMTPRRSGGPVAVSVTTAPSISQSVRATVSAAADDVLTAADTASRTVRSARISSFNAVPNAIAAVPSFSGNLNAAGGAAAAATILPELTDQVILLTEQYAYRVAWRDVALVSVTGDAIVLAADGSIVGRFEDGHFIVSTDAMVGAALARAAD